MPIIVVDVESRPDKQLLDEHLKNLSAPSNIKDEKKIKARLDDKRLEAYKELSVDPDRLEIVCIGIKKDEEEARIVTLEEFLPLLTPENTFVTFNGKSFDFPAIYKIAVKKGLSNKTDHIKNLIKRYNNYFHHDLIEIISMGRPPKKKKEYVKIYLGENEKEINFETASYEEIVEHNLCDLDYTYRLYQLFKNLI